MNTVKKYLLIVIVILAALLRAYYACYLPGDFCRKEYGEEKREVGVFKSIRNSVIRAVDSNFPSPHSELLLGMLIGLDRLKNVPSFSHELKITSTVHVVVVSGFNIALVFNLVTKLLGSQYKLRNVILAQIATSFYALLSGFEPPVVRALVMGSIVAWGKFYGRIIDGLSILIFAASLMVIISPTYLFNISFQLSFAASLGLIQFSSIFSNMKLPEDLSSTLAAQVFVWPIISSYFGTVGILGILVNPFILWTVPVSTILGGIFILGAIISPLLAKLTSVILFPFLDIFVRIVTLFGSWENSVISYRMNGPVLAIYYFSILFLLFLRNRGVSDRSISKIKK